MGNISASRTWGTGESQLREKQPFPDRSGSYVKAFASKGDPGAQRILPADQWYLKNAAARAQGNFWFHVLVGR